MLIIIRKPLVEIRGSRMKIGILTEALKQGGVERTIVNLDNSLSQYEKKIILYDSSDISYEVSSSIHNIGLAIYPFKNIIQEISTVLIGALKLRKYIASEDIKICISFKEHPNIINVLSGKSLSIISVREHKSSGLKFRGILGFLIKYMISFIYNRADVVVAVSRGVADDLIDNFRIDRHKIFVLYNGCDYKNIKKLSFEDVVHRFHISGPVVVTVGRLSREKLHWQLIRSFSRVVQMIPGAGLIIVGSGEELGYLEKISASLHLEHCVFFAGFQKNPYKYLINSDLFVLSSAWEGFPNVILEAMACGLPVISVDCETGPRELLAPDIGCIDKINSVTFAEYGVLLPKLDGKYKKVGESLTEQEILMADSIVHLLNDSELRAHYQEKSNLRVKDFSLDKFSDGWTCLINSLLEKT